jgi:hypothetical protein
MSDYQPIIWEIFIVRLRRETAGSAWRGQIVHLPDRQSCSFATLAQAEAFIARFVPGLAVSEAHDRAGDGSPQREKQNTSDVVGTPTPNKATGDT